MSASESPLPTLRFLSVAADRVKPQALAFRCILHPDSVGMQQGLQAYVPVAPWVKTMCIYTMSIHSIDPIYLASDLEDSNNCDPIYGINRR